MKQLASFLVNQGTGLLGWFFQYFPFKYNKRMGFYVVIVEKYSQIEPYLLKINLLRNIPAVLFFFRNGVLTILLACTRLFYLSQQLGTYFL